MIADVIVPALDEAPSIARVVRSIPTPPIRRVIVVDNGSSDRTAALARTAGAMVVAEPRRGYGAACLAGLRALPGDTEVVVFLDGDGSDDPALIPALLEPIARGDADFVVGARAVGRSQRGALSIQQRIGNGVAATWLRARFRLPASDLGPFRAIRRTCLDALGMSDPDYGWTVEMQIKAARAGLSYVEVPVPYRRREGRSKISGTVRGVVGAALKILGSLAWYDILGSRRTSSPSPSRPAIPRSNRISIVIPVLDEERWIGRQLAELGAMIGIHEVIVVDGGSGDRTCEIVRRFPNVRCLSAPRGRGPQLNAGARAASGDVLLFLHADVALPRNAAAWVNRALSDPAVVAGAFRTWTICDEERSWLSPFFHLADIRSHVTRLFYGDQAIFVRRRAFDRIGGFPDQPLMEDIELSRRLQRLGKRITVPAYVRVSGRRFVRRPLAYAAAANLFPPLFRLGVSADVLARVYGTVR